MRFRSIAGLVAASLVSPYPAAALAAGSVEGWDQAFPVTSAPARVYARAEFTSGRDGKLHQLQLWRVGDRLLHRQTDDRIDLYLGRDSGAKDFRYRLIDRDRQTVIDVDRFNLYRIGVFSDWPTLAHVLDRPKAGDRVVAMAAAPSVATAAQCQWHAIVRAAVTGTRPERDEVCWSRRWALPMLIRRAADVSGQASTEQFRITEVRTPSPEELSDQMPEPPPGFHLVDANRDISPDVD